MNDYKMNDYKVEDIVQHKTSKFNTKIISVKEYI